MIIDKVYEFEIKRCKFRVGKDYVTYYRIAEADWDGDIRKRVSNASVNWLREDGKEVSPEEGALVEQVFLCEETLFYD